MARFAWPDRYTPDAENYGLPKAGLALLEAYYDNGWRAVDELRALKAYHPMIWPSGDDETPQVGPNRVPAAIARAMVDYYDHAPENLVPRGRCLAAGDQAGQNLMGAGLVGAFEDWLVGRDVPILTDHRVRHLALDETGRVTGVVAEHGGREIAIRATHGVIFGTGGYAHSQELQERYQKTRIFGSCAGAGSTGDFIPMAGEARAMLGNMTSVWGGAIILEQSLDGKPLGTVGFTLPGDSMIFVNRTGRRVVNEHRNYSSRARVHEDYDPSAELYPNKFLFMILDERSRNRFAGAYPIPGLGERPDWLIEAATIDDFAEKLSARLASLEPRVGEFTLVEDFASELRSEIGRFNGFAATGVDADFNRGAASYDIAALSRTWSNNVTAPHTSGNYENGAKNPNLYPIANTGPYFAIIIARGALDTNGGPVTNENAQVCDANGAPIPGLYGAGNCIAAPTREAYLGPGGTIGPAITFAYIAANHASTAV
jgi:succinate dehydrogenase/fumarate reductase flavoprotein subunit